MATVIQLSESHDLPAAPVVVIGSGPVGVRTVQEIVRRAPAASVILCGAEAWQPYNRVRLSSLLAGDLGLDGLTADFELPRHGRVDERYGCPITAIDRENQRIIDARGRSQRYGTLVIATGSRPRIPNLPNVNLSGVFTFRDFADAQALYARRMRSRRTVVLGGGLLGLEAARAMRRFNTEVLVVEHENRLMPRQLDAEAAELLRAHIESMGIEVRLGESVRAIEGDVRVTGVRFRNGDFVACDTVVLATGIEPNVDLARRAGLSVGRGIRVNEEMRTSDPRIFAVGECAEFAGSVYGLVAPGLEQATVAATVITGGKAQYLGSTLTTRLKVVGLPVFSIGRVVEDDLDHRMRCYVYRDASKGQYAKVVTQAGRLVGALAIGNSTELGRLQEAVTHQRAVWPWQLWSFRRDGRLWHADQDQSVTAWPASAVVCNCTGVTRGQLSAAAFAGCKSVAELAARTGASTVCGSCRPLLAEIAGGPVAAPPMRWARSLGVLGVVAALVALLHLIPWNIPYANSMQAPWRWDLLWRDSFYKQVSGYTLLALSVLAAVLSVRKRWTRFRFGDFATWRIVHVAVGVLTLLGLLVHTGGRVGPNLSGTLSSIFIGLLLLGSLASIVAGLEHRLGRDAPRARRQLVWLHLLLLWPVPVLIGFHIVQAYYF